MDELYSIMRDFLEVEYNQKSLLYLLKSAEKVFTAEEQAEMKLVVNGTTCYLQTLQGELRSAINRMDSYIAEHKKKQ